ncbi:ABC transporter G family member 17 [Cucumispora dikerogammari]|nr:ABC transporter G family member 17 [Cucumispora dikerogammari]
MFSFTNIQHKIGTVKIFDKNSINIPPNKITMILGPSGSGKTTLLKLISGRINSKNLKLNDKRISSKYLNSRTSFVYQHHNLPEYLTVNEYFNFSYNCKMSITRNSPSTQNKIDDLLKKLEIFDVKDRRIGDKGCNLSGGQLKRIELGVEIICGDEILMVDEPLSGLDSYNSAIILKQMKETKRTVVMSVHSPSSKVLEYCDHIVILNKTKTFFEGTKTELVDYIQSLGYTYIDSDKTNGCEFVFNHVLPIFNQKHETRAGFVYKKTTLADDKQVTTHSEKQTSSVKRFTASVINLLKRNFVRLYRDYMNLGGRVLLAFISCIYILYKFKEFFVTKEKTFAELNLSQKHLELIKNIWIPVDYTLGLNIIFLSVCACFAVNSSRGTEVFLRDFFLIIKENSNNYYSLFAYVFSTLLFEFTISSLITVLPYIICLSIIPSYLGIEHKIGLILGLFSCTFVSLGFSMMIAAFFYGYYIRLVFVFGFWFLCFICAFELNLGLPKSYIFMFLESNSALNYGMCLAVKVWTTQANKEHIEKTDYYKDLNKSFYGKWSTVVLYIFVMCVYSILTYLFFCWKARNSKGIN